MSPTTSTQSLSSDQTNVLTSQLLQDISQLYDQADDYNVKLTIGQEPNKQIFSAHSVILRSRSPYFKTALSEPWAKKDGDMFLFAKPNIEPWIFAVILKYIYTGTISLDTIAIDYTSLLKAADELILISLVTHIQEHIIINDHRWLDHNLVLVYQMSLQHSSLSILLKYCEDRITTDPGQFYASSDFLALDERGIINLLKRDDFGMDEINIWESVVKWGIAQCPTLLPDVTEWSQPEWALFEKTLRPLIPHIRFFHISSTDYYYRVAPFKKILPVELRKSLKVYYFVSGTKIPPSHTFPPRTPIHKIDSEIITPKQSAFLAHWIDGHNNTPLPFSPHGYKFKRLLRGSEHGFDMYEFHVRCDLKGPTIVLIKIAGNKKVIGGYNPHSWESTGGYKATSKSFIFSFLNDEANGGIQGENGEKDFVLSRVKKERHAIKDFSGSIGGENVGFGDGDLPLFAYNLTHKSYERKIIDEKMYLIEEYEVFLVEKAGDMK